jgi:hypothetical protein
MKVCRDAIEWLEKNVDQTPQWLWDNCEYGGWLLSYGLRNGVSHHRVCQIALECVLEILVALEKFGFDIDGVLRPVVSASLSLLRESNYDDIDVEQIDPLTEQLPVPSMLRHSRNFEANVVNATAMVVYGLKYIKFSYNGLQYIEEITGYRFADYVREQITHEEVRAGRIAKKYQKKPSPVEGNWRENYVAIVPKLQTAMEFTKQHIKSNRGIEPIEQGENNEKRS